MFDNYQNALLDVQNALDSLKSIAETIMDRMRDVIDACETLEEDL